MSQSNSSHALPPPQNPPRNKRRRTSPPTPKKPRKPRQNQKVPQNGLKTFTMSVVAKLRNLKSPSSYTAVADDLVRDAFTRLHQASQTFNPQEIDKNVRRRVYDALNVLSSMGFVARSGKHVTWHGIAGFHRHVSLPLPKAPPLESLVQKQQAATAAVQKSIALKRTLLESLRTQQSSLQRLVSRNVARDSARVTTGLDVLVGDSLEYVHPDPHRVPLPFLLISAPPLTTVAVEMDPSHQDILFRFDKPFQIHHGYNVVAKVCSPDSAPVSPFASDEPVKPEIQLETANLVKSEPGLEREGCRPLGYEFRDPHPGKSEICFAPVEERYAVLPRITGLKRRRTPPCFALHRPESLR